MKLRLWIPVDREVKSNLAAVCCFSSSYVNLLIHAHHIFILKVVDRIDIITMYRGFQIACEKEKCQMQSPLTLTNH